MATGSPVFIETVIDAARVVNGGPGHILGFFVMNAAAAIGYVQIFDAAAADVTLATTVPKMVIPMAASLPYHSFGGNGIEFVNAISCACTTTPTGSTAGDADITFIIG